MSASPTRPQPELRALVRAAKAVIDEIERRVANLDEAVDPLDAQSKGADEEAEAYVDTLLSRVRLSLPNPHTDDRDREGPSTLLSVRDVARLCQVSEKTVRFWKENGTLPRPITLGGVIRFRWRDIEALIDGGGTE